ncbi:MAG: hypothetical protein M3O91_08965 [Chloroflexota bacterium]|nr:hypothetical protein [Chloroflexota bacterium]
MAQQAPVRLRPLTRAERATLKSKLRQVSLPARLHRRYRLIEEVRRGHPLHEAASRAGLNQNSGYLWVPRFNKTGFRGFETPNNPRGRVPIITSRQLRELVDVALSSPAELGLPFTTWTVRTLTEYCTEHNLIPEFTDEWVRRVLRREGLSAQRIRTWKTSTDPLFGPKGGASAPSAKPARRTRRSSVSTSGARSSSGR